MINVHDGTGICAHACGVRVLKMNYVHNNHNVCNVGLVRVNVSRGLLSWPEGG